jgi:hypothetical protein
MDVVDTPRFNKKEYNKAYIQANKEKYYKMSNDRNKERYYTDEEFRKKIIERAKISVKSKRMNNLKSIHPE